MSDKIEAPPVGEPHESLALLIMEICQKGMSLHFHYGENSVLMVIKKDNLKTRSCTFSQHEIGCPTLFHTKYDSDALLAGLMRRAADDVYMGRF